jgi:hypothetical protein
VVGTPKTVITVLAVKVPSFEIELVRVRLLKFHSVPDWFTEVAFQSPSKRAAFELIAKFGPSGYFPHEPTSKAIPKSPATLNNRVFFMLLF